MRVRPRRRRMRLIVAGETPTAAAMCWPVQRWRRRASMVATVAAGVGLCRRWGREERSCRPLTPSVWKRATHLRAVLTVTPKAAATAFTCHHPPHQFGSTVRQPGILMNVHPVLRGDAEASQLQLPRSEPDGQPNESSHLSRGAQAGQRMRAVIPSFDRNRCLERTFPARLRRAKLTIPDADRFVHMLEDM